MDKVVNVKINVNDDGKIDKLNAEADKLGKKTIEPTLNTKKIDDFILNLTGDPIKVAFDGDFGDITKQLEQLKKELRAITGQNESKVKIPIAIEGIDQLLEKLDSLKLSLKNITSYLGMKNIRKPEFIKQELDSYEKLQKQIEAARDSAKMLFEKKIPAQGGTLRDNRSGFWSDNAKNYIETLFGDPDSLKSAKTQTETILKYIEEIKNAGFDLSKIEVGKSSSGLHSLLDIVNEISKIDKSAFDKYRLSFEGIVGTISKVDLAKQTASIEQQLIELNDAGGDASKIRELTSELEKLHSVQVYEPKSIVDNKSYEELLQTVKALNEELKKAQAMGQGALKVDLNQSTLDKLSELLSTLSNITGKLDIKDGTTLGIDAKSLNQIIKSVSAVKDEISNVTSVLQGNSKPIEIKVDAQNVIDEVGKIKDAINELPEEKTIKIGIDGSKSLENQLKNNTQDSSNNSFENLGNSGNNAGLEITESMGKAAEAVNSLVQLANDASTAIQNVGTSISNITGNKSREVLNAFRELDRKYAEGTDTEYGFAFDSRTGRSSSLITGENRRIAGSQVADSINQLQGKADSFIHTHPDVDTAAFSLDEIKGLFSDYADGIKKQLVKANNEIAQLDVEKLVKSGINKDDLVERANAERAKAILEYKNDNYDRFGLQNIIPENYAEILGNNIKQTLESSLKESGSSIEIGSLESLSNELLTNIVSNIKSRVEGKEVFDTGLVSDELNNTLNDVIHSSLKNLNIDNVNIVDTLRNDIGGLIDNLIPKNLNKVGGLALTKEEASRMNQIGLRRAIDSYGLNGSDVYKVTNEKDLLTSMYENQIKFVATLDDSDLRSKLDDLSKERIIPVKIEPIGDLTQIKDALNTNNKAGVVDVSATENLSAANERLAETANEAAEAETNLNEVVNNVPNDNVVAPQATKNEELVASLNEVSDAIHNVTEVTSTVDETNVANLVPDTSAIEKAVSDFELLTNYINGYIEAQKKLNSGNYQIVEKSENGFATLVDYDDYRQGKVTKASIKRILGEFRDHYQQATTGYQYFGDEPIKLTEENINFHKNAANKSLDELAAHVHAFKDMETAATLFGKKNAEVFDEVQRRIENAKVAQEGFEETDWYEGFLLDNLREKYGVSSVTFGQLDQLTDSIKTGGIEGFASKVEELFGVKIPTSIEQAKASITGLDLSNTSISPDAVNNTADAYNNLADSATKAGEAISNIQASTSELTLADDTISHIIPEDIAEKARQQIEEIKGYVNGLISNIPQVDPEGVFSKYLLGENGAKTAQQLIDEIQNEIKNIDDRIFKDYQNGKVLSDEQYLQAYAEPFKKLNAAQAFGLIDYDYKKSFGQESASIEYFYKKWQKQELEWRTRSDSLSDDAFSAFGGLFDYSNSLSAMQKNGGQDYIDYLTQLTTLSEQAKKVISDNKNRQQVDFSTMNISTEDAQSTAQGLLQEKEAIDGLINSIREFQSKNKVFEFSDMQLGNEDFISKLYSLQDISKLLEETADNYERLNIKQQGFQRDIFDNVIDKTLKQGTEIPKELENYADQLWDKITSPSDKGLSGQEAIDMFNQKAKELGVTFDELSNKWVQISSIEQPNIQDTGSQLEQEAEAREHVAEAASHQAEQITNVNSVEGTSTTTVDTSSIENLTNANLEATESANQLAEAQQHANEVTSSESSVSSKVGEYEQLAEAANQATEAEANVSKPVETPQDVSGLVGQMTALAEQLNSQTQALQRQASEVQNIVSTEQESFSNLANTITEITEKYSQFSQEIAKITQTENTATTYQASPIENVEQLTTAYQTLSKAILEAQDAQSKLTSLSTETVDAEGTKSTVSYVSQFSELGTVISDIARDVNGLSAFISKVNEATSNNGISDYSQTVDSLSNALANLKPEDITRIDDLSLKLGQLVSITPDSISGVLNSVNVSSTASKNIESLAAAFDRLKTALSGFSGDSNFASTIQPLTELLSRSTQLQNLADILKESESKIKAVKEKVGTSETDIGDRQAEEYKKLTDAVNKYAEAKKVLDSGAGTVSKQQLAEYKQAMDTQKEYISKVGLYNEKMQEASMKPISTQNLKDVQTAENVLSKVYSYLGENKKVSGFESQFQNLKQQADTLKEIVVSVKDNISDISSENLKQLSNDLSKAFSQTSSAISKELKTRETSSVKALKETGISSALKDAKEVVALNSQSTFQPMVDQLALVNEKIKETEDLLNSLDLKNLSDVDISNITAKADELRDLYAQTQSSQFAPVNEEYRANVLSSLDNWLNTNAQAADTYRERIEALKTTVQEAQNQLQVESADYDLHQIQMQYDSDEANKIATREAKYKELAEAVQEYAKALLDANKKIISGKGADIDFDRIQQLKKAYEDLFNEIKNNKDLYDSDKNAEAMQPIISLGDDIQKMRERVQATKDLSEARKILKDTDAYIEKNPFKEGTQEYNALEETRKKVEELRNALNDLKSDTDTNGIRVLASDTKQSLLDAQQAIKNINQQGKERLNEIGVSQALSRANAFVAQNQGTEFEPMIQQLSEVQSKAQNVSDILRNLDVNNASQEELQGLRNAVAELNAEVNKGKTEQFIPADLNKYQKTLASFEAFLNGNPLTAQTYANEVEYLRQALEDAAKSGSQFDLNSVIAQMDAFKAKALEAGNVGESFGQKLAKTFSGLGRYLATYVSFYRIVGVIKDAIKTVRELDTAFKDIRMVSSESMKTISDYQKESFKMADQIGSNAIDLQKSTAQWVRLGYDFNEAAKASQASSWLVNVSEFDNIDDATTALVSMKAAYDDLDFTSILDKLNAIGDSFSSSTDQLASGLQNSAAVLKLQGNDIDQALALLTAGNDVTQDMSKTSAGVRTIALRIAGLLPENMATY